MIKIFPIRIVEKNSSWKKFGEHTISCESKKIAVIITLRNIKTRTIDLEPPSHFEKNGSLSILRLQKIFNSLYTKK